jgi:GNAT superfamily N-acetyltransferase
VPDHIGATGRGGKLDRVRALVRAIDQRHLPDSTRPVRLPCWNVDIMPEPPIATPGSVPPSTLRVEAVSEATAEDWRRVHNVVIPTAPLTTEQVRERRGRYRLTVAYVGDRLTGCATVRPPDEEGNVTIIVRILPDYRRRGYGETLFLEEVQVARDLGGVALETIVLASNLDGLRFALGHGFVEVSRYLPPDSEEPFITLRLR